MFQFARDRRREALDGHVVTRDLANMNSIAIKHYSQTLVEKKQFKGDLRVPVFITATSTTNFIQPGLDRGIQTGESLQRATHWLKGLILQNKNKSGNKSTLTKADTKSNLNHFILMAMYLCRDFSGSITTWFTHLSWTMEGFNNGNTLNCWILLSIKHIPWNGNIHY